METKPGGAARAERNVRRIDPTGVARVVADDAVGFVGRYASRIDLLYLDADGTGDRGKGIYLDILAAGYDRMPDGSLVLAHNSVNCAGQLSEYLEHVRDPTHFRASVNVILDPEGLEVSVKERVRRSVPREERISVRSGMGPSGRLCQPSLMFTASICCRRVPRKWSIKGRLAFGPLTPSCMTTRAFAVLGTRNEG